MLTSATIHDTIAAISSPPGAAVRGIVRMSGPDAWRIARELVTPFTPRPRRAFPCRLKSPPLPALVLLFAGPASFTGLDTAELHVPGSPPLLAMVLQQAIAAGARQADAGEFTAQAFLNGKLDLTQAEGIAATIAAGNARQLAAAAQLRSGALHEWTHRLADDLAQLLALVEASIDFTDEAGVSFIADADLRAQLGALRARIAELTRHAARWERLDGLPTILFTGRPNVGKSSLLNALAGAERALVSPIAGTTRDVLGVTLDSPLGPLRLLDVAGCEDSLDDLPTQMNAARRRAIQQADLVVLVIDDHDTAASAAAQLGEILSTHEAAPHDVLLLRNKADLPGRNPAAAPPAALEVSARTGAGLDTLWRELLHRLRACQPGAHEQITLNQRHRRTLTEAAGALAAAEQQATAHSVMDFPELIAAEMRRALDIIGEVSGGISPDDVLGRIFGTFCIGK